MEASFQSTRPEINTHESTRLAGACALLLGPLYRRAVIRRARDRFSATAPELGLDYGLLLLICKHLELRATQYQVFYLASFLASLGIFALAPSIGIFMFSIPLAAYFYKASQERFALLPLFQADRFDPDEVAQAFAIDLPHRLVEGVPLDHQNILIHSGNNPFVGAGTKVGQWSFSLDLSRPTQLNGRTVETVDGAEIYGAIQAAIKRLQLPNLQIRDCVLVNGSELDEDSTILAGPFDRPNQRVGASELRRIRGRAGSLRRHYKWILIPDWGGEVIFSSFVRCVVRGDTLFVEVLHFLLPPIAPQFRRIDTLLRPGLITNLLWFSRTVALAPLSIFWGMVDFASKTLEYVWWALGLPDFIIRWFIIHHPSFNRGALRSLRERMGGSFNAYFQQSDFQFYDKTLGREIHDTVVDFLRDRGVDTSRLREEQPPILHNSIWVQGGDVKASNLAVGRGAKAVAFKRIVASIRPPCAK